MFEVFLGAVVLALLVTVYSVPDNVKVLALTIVAPFVALGLLLIRYCRRGSAWAFAGCAILAAAGVGLRLVINAHPNLEVGGGLPLWVTVVYVALGLSVSLSSGWAAFAIKVRKRSGIAE